jgi:hypothetical protein
MTVFETHMTTLETSIHSNITTVFGRLDRIQIPSTGSSAGSKALLLPILIMMIIAANRYSRRQLLTNAAIASSRVAS